MEREEAEVELHLQKNVLLKTKMSTFFYVNNNNKRVYQHPTAKDDFAGTQEDEEHRTLKSPRQK